MKVAAAGGVLGEKIKIDSVFNCLVNDQGKIEIIYQRRSFSLETQHVKYHFEACLKIIDFCKKEKACLVSYHSLPILMYVLLSQDYLTVMSRVT